MRAFATVVAAAIVGLALAATDARTTAAREPTTQGSPNIVLFLTDDQTIDEMGHMPVVDAELIGKGVSFKNGFVVNPLCCPSRASILTGKYSHGTDVYKNTPPHGGFQTFRPQDASTIATWLQAAGYETALVGKYLNGYKGTYEPRGWSTWNAELVKDSKEGGYYDYWMNIDGQLVWHGSDESDYSTDVLAGNATAFIRGAPAGKPLFLYFAPHAPHEPATPANRDLDQLPHLPKYRPPNFNEADMSDKPPWAQALPLLTKNQIHLFDAFRERQFRSLLAVDDAVGDILAALADTGRVNDTLFVFMSDNGLEDGSHRWLPKVVPWDESIRVPFVVRYDPLTASQPRTDPHIVLNIDLAPTFADIAGIAAPGAEGRSILPLLSPVPPPWREDFLIEHVVSHNRENSKVPTYCAVRTTQYLYTDYQLRDHDNIQVQEELYDLATDPFELNNVAGLVGYEQVQSTLRERMLHLCSPPPPKFVP